MKFFEFWVNVLFVLSLEFVYLYVIEEVIIWFKYKLMAEIINNVKYLYAHFHWHLGF